MVIAELANQVLTASSTADTKADSGNPYGSPNRPHETYAESEIELVLNVSALAAGATLIVTVYATTEDAKSVTSPTWYVKRTFATMNSTGTAIITWADLGFSVGRALAIGWVLSGSGTPTASFTVRLAARAVR